MIFMLHVNWKMLFTCFAILLVSISKKIKEVLILDFRHNSVNSWGSSFAFVFVLIDSLLYVDSHSIKHAIETGCIVIGIFHRIVSQDVEIHISTSHTRVLWVCDGDVHIQTEVFQSKRLSKMVKWEMSTYIFGVNQSCHVGLLWSQHNLVVQEYTRATRFPVVEGTYHKLETRLYLLFYSG